MLWFYQLFVIQILSLLKLPYFLFASNNLLLPSKKQMGRRTGPICQESQIKQYQIMMAHNKGH